MHHSWYRIPLSLLYAKNKRERKQSSQCKTFSDVKNYDSQAAKDTHDKLVTLSVKRLKLFKYHSFIWQITFSEMLFIIFVFLNKEKNFEKYAHIIENVSIQWKVTSLMKSIATNKTFCFKIWMKISIIGSVRQLHCWSEVCQGWFYRWHTLTWHSSSSIIFVLEDIV